MPAIEQFKHFKGIYTIKDPKSRDPLILTRNLTPGKTVYDEELYYGAPDEHGNKIEYRTWNPKKSKLGSSLLKDVSQIGIQEGYYVLYLGASTGTTASHVSDIVGKDGLVYALDFAPRVLRDLVFVAEARRNIAPILADANRPEDYAHLASQVDTVFMDIAQRNQLEIFLKNCKMFLKSGGFGLLALKARSVDVTRNPKEIFKEIRSLLEKEMTIVDYRELAPFEYDHALFVVKKK